MTEPHTDEYGDPLPADPHSDDWYDGYAAGQRDAALTASPEGLDVERPRYTAYVDGRACHNCGQEPYRHECSPAEVEPRMSEPLPRPLTKDEYERVAALIAEMERALIDSHWSKVSKRDWLRSVIRDDIGRLVALAASPELDVDGERLRDFMRGAAAGAKMARPATENDDGPSRPDGLTARRAVSQRDEYTPRVLPQPASQDPDHD